MSEISPHGFLPYGRQSLDDADIQAVVDVLRGDWLTTGPAVARFEAALAEATGATYAVVCSSGTAALHMMYSALGVGDGDEVITSPLTFAATANAAHYLGARVRFVDVSPDTGNIDPALIEAAIGPRTRLIVAVDYAGHPAAYAAIHEIGRRRGVTVVSDAAHALGATLHGAPVGKLSHAAAISMHPVKPITSAEGGAVLTDDAELAARATRFRSHGISRDPVELTRDDGPWYMEQHDLGFNYRMTDLQAALGASQLAKLPAFIARRAALAARYTAGLSDLEGMRLPIEGEGARSGWHLYVVRVDPSRRRAFFERLRALGIGAQVHYLPVYRHPWYQQNGYARVQCPEADAWYASCVSLPLYPGLTDAEHASAIARVRQAWEEMR